MIKTAASHRVDSDPAYYELERLIADRVASINQPLFTTNASGLFEAYLGGIPKASRQHYTCRCCRKFIERYGGLVAIDEAGLLHPAIWSLDSVPEFFDESAGCLRKALYRAKVTGIFINGDKEWGKAKTGDWTHLHGTPATVFRGTLKTAGQEAAEKLQDFIMLKAGLSDYSMDAAVQAVRVLQADAVDRSERTLGVAEWFLKLHQAVCDVRGPLRDNLIWLAVAKAPPGWCHIRSTMISTLLDDIVAGLPFESISSRWAAKMHPLRYQRPTTVSDGNIEQANKVVAKLQSEGALARRFAKLEEVAALWTPRPVDLAKQQRAGGVFDHLKAANGSVKPVRLPAIKMTWAKFKEIVLPEAHGIEVDINFYVNLPFFGLVTAANTDSQPTLQWDGLEGCARNPVSWYFYHGGSCANDWDLHGGWTKVNAICLKPSQWQQPEKFKYQGHGVFFVLDGARDMRHKYGAGFFPECLRSEYHGIRRAMEAYARGAAIAGRDEGTANGIALGDRQMTVRVKAVGGEQLYTIQGD